MAASFQYKHGDRPLDGYTIQRAAGRGGFGEVYYAISDAGREVALKVITGFQEIELRGIGQCMNLKSPYLVTIFDVKHNAEGRPFVVMEYVNGPNLRELLDESPAGLGTQKAAFFLREIAKGLSYLHDCGIVHRDLKPANIFFENGYVKIGDYGLSKAIEPTHHSGQTVTVGTVHYMAPEVGCGKYDRSIDIYALGALLYEMMTGIVPFVGASAGEILIKHLSHEADCSGIPEPFCGAIKKAMAKDPLQRFQTVQEMVEAIFGAEHVRNSVSQFSPNDLSMVAGKVAQRIAGAPVPPSAGTTSDPFPGGSSVTNPNGLGSPKSPMPGGAYTAGRIAGEAMGEARRVGSAILQPLDCASPAPLPDSVRTGQRLGLGVVAALVIATGAVAFDRPTHETDVWLYTFLSVVGGSCGIVFAARNWLPRPVPGSRWSDRFALAAIGAAFSILLSAPIWMNSFEARSGVKAELLAALFALAVADPRRWTNADREQRIRFKFVASAGAIAFAAALVFHGNPVLSIAAICGICLMVQVLAPWDERRAEANSTAGSDAGPRARNTRATTAPQPAPPRPVMPTANGVYPPPLPRAARNVPTSKAVALHAVPRAVVIGWFCGTLGFFVIGFALLIGAIANGPQDRDFPDLMAGAAAMAVLTLFCFVRLCVRRYTSAWTYIALPGARVVCAVVIATLWAQLAFGHNGRSDEQDMVVAMSIFASLWLLLWLVPSLWRLAIPPAGGPKSTAFALGQALGEVRSAINTSVTATPDGGVQTSTEANSWTTSSAVPPSSPSSFEGEHWRRRFERERDRRMRRMRRRFGQGDAPRPWNGGFVAFVTLSIAFTLTFALAFDIPTMIRVGVPDQSLNEWFTREVFGPGVPNWVPLLANLTFMSACVLYVIGLIALLVARKAGGLFHMFRAVLGVAVLAVCLLPGGIMFSRAQPWFELSRQPVDRRGGWMMVQAVLDALNHAESFLTLGLLVFAAVLLAWPVRVRTARQVAAPASAAATATEAMSSSGGSAA
jgi:hypothetical protein